MAERLTRFLVVFMLIFQTGVLGQGKKGATAGNATLSERLMRNQYAELYCPGVCFDENFSQSEFFIHRMKFKTNFAVDPVMKTYPGKVNPAVLPASFYTKQLGFFCQKELWLYKTTSIPFRFRLGSLEYVNWLEQKPNAIKPN